MFVRTICNNKGNVIDILSEMELICDFLSKPFVQRSNNTSMSLKSCFPVMFSDLDEYNFDVNGLIKPVRKAHCSVSIK